MDTYIKTMYLMKNMPCDHPVTLLNLLDFGTWRRYFTGKIGLELLQNYLD